MWPQWGSFAGVSQQGLDFSKKIRKKKIDLTFTDVDMGHQKVPKSDFQSQFSMSKIIRIFLIFFNIEVYKKVFCYCHFLKTSIFEPLCFLKWCPIFDGPCEHLWKSNQKNIIILLIFLLKSTPCWLTAAKLHHWGHTKLAVRQSHNRTKSAESFV